MPLRRRYATFILSHNVVIDSDRPRNPHSVDTIDPFHLGLSPNPGPAEADEMDNVSLGPGPKLPTPPVLSESRDSLLPSVSSHGTLRDPRPTGSPRVSSRRFERPNYLHIFAHAVFCCAAYPVIYAGTIAAKDRSLFWARVIVGLWCAGVGVVIGWSLMGFATKYMEASSKHASPSFAPRGCPTRSLPILGSVGNCDPSQPHPRRTGDQVERART